MPSAMTSRERMLAALRHQQPDHTPCSFMIFGALKSRCRDYSEFIDRQVGMGLDAVVEVPTRPPQVVNDHYNLHGLPVSYAPGVTLREWVEQPTSEPTPILVKEYATPDGTLRAEVRKTHDWRWGDHVPLLDDYIVPRSRKFLVTQESDLPALKHLLVEPTAGEIGEFGRDARKAKVRAQRDGLLVAGGWGVGADLVGWICGLQPMVYMAYDTPDVLRQLLELIASWNRRRMEVVLEPGIDLYIKRAWYENLDFWTPASWREHILPILTADAELAHERGALFGYLITSNCMSLLDMIAEAEVDVIVGLDPHAWDMEQARRILAGRVCLWGGVNGHLTVESASQDDVRQEVQRAITTFGRGGGFILSPVDNVREDTALSRENVTALIDEWRRLTGTHAGGLSEQAAGTM